MARLLLLAAVLAGLVLGGEVTLHASPAEPGPILCCGINNPPE